MNLVPLLLAFVPPSDPANASDPGNAGDWTQFRGSLGTGVAVDGDVPTSWSAESVAWKVALPGSGWSQPVVLGTRVYVTVAVGQELESPKGFAAGVSDPRTNQPGALPGVEIEWQVVALDLESGQQRWAATAKKAQPSQPIHPSNTYATETPCVDEHGVYAFFGATGTVAAFDHEGQALWTAELGARPTAAGYGTASSPALFDGTLFVQCFDEGAAFLAAFDTKSGLELWRASRETPGTSWSSPLVWHNTERVEVVTSGNELTIAYDPKSGKELWRLNGVVGPGTCSFGADSERLYLGQKSPMANPPLYALKAGATGDLSPAKGSAEIGFQAWSQSSASPGMPSPVAVDGLLYIVAETFLSCRDATSGELLYKERLDGLATVAASLIVVGPCLYILDEAGSARAVAVGPEFEIVGKGHIDDLFWSTPAVAGNALLLRGASHLYCVRSGS